MVSIPAVINTDDRSTTAPVGSASSDLAAWLEARELEIWSSLPDPFAPAAPLGTIGGICYTSPPAVDDNSTVPRDDSRLGRYALQSVARDYLCATGGKEELAADPWHRLAGCHRRRSFRTLPDGTREPRLTVDVLHDAERRRAYYAGLQTCGYAAACPVCGGVIWDVRKAELGQGLQSHRAAGGGCFFATLTARHSRDTELAPFVGALAAALRSVYTGKAFTDFKRRVGYLGAVRALEVTHGGKGWHPHSHLLWFTERPVDASLVDEVRHFLERRWMAALKQVGLDGLVEHAVKVGEASWTIEEYMTKIGHARNWDLDAELTMGARKQGRRGGVTPADMLRAGLSGEVAAAARARALYRDYAAAMKGVHSLRWSAKLRERLGLGDDVDDAAIAAGETADRELAVLARLSSEDWRLVLANDVRGELLQVANAGDAVLVAEFLDCLK